jgi:hypothetical protein
MLLTNGNYRATIWHVWLVTHLLSLPQPQLLPAPPFDFRELYLRQLSLRQLRVFCVSALSFLSSNDVSCKL